VRVLVVEDHRDLVDLVERALRADGHSVETAATLAEAVDRLRDRPADVLVLDLGLPDGSGFDLCRSLRRDGVNTPILLITANAPVRRRVEGLDAGADDFLGKPFALAELRARVRALGRRGTLPRKVHVVRGATTLDFLARRAEVAGVEVPLTAREWAVLDLLVARAGRAVARTEILEIVWGDPEQGGASLEVLVARIRKKVGDDVVRTVRGYGYALAVG